jgi:hypothetical protein
MHSYPLSCVHPLIEAYPRKRTYIEISPSRPTVVLAEEPLRRHDQTNHPEGALLNHELFHEQCQCTSFVLALILYSHISNIVSLSPSQPVLCIVVLGPLPKMKPCRPAVQPKQWDARPTQWARLSQQLSRHRLPHGMLSNSEDSLRPGTESAPHLLAPAYKYSISLLCDIVLNSEIVERCTQ